MTGRGSEIRNTKVVGALVSNWVEQTHKVRFKPQEVVRDVGHGGAGASCIATWQCLSMFETEAVAVQSCYAGRLLQFSSACRDRSGSRLGIGLAEDQVPSPHDEHEHEA